jgi:tetratricopeptide (TPR) repeat protein
MRIAARAMLHASVFALVVISIVGSLGCEQLDGRNRNRQGNRLFREMQFANAAGEYEKALAEVDDPTIHYNLGLAYSKVFKPGLEGDVLLGTTDSSACKLIPKVKAISKQVCVKPGSTAFIACDDKNVCASSFKCIKADLCALDDAAIADLAATHFSVWLKSNAADTETRALMTQVWMDSSQYKKAIEYWEELLKAKPKDPEIMGNLAGINLKANDWRKSIEWYLQVADAATDPSAKVAAFQFIGNVAWSKLNSKSLTAAASIELADRGIGALEKASALQPKNGKLYGLMASIYNFRALSQGASWASALERATAQDRQHTSRVLNDEAKKAQGQDPSAPAPAAPAPGAANNPAPSPVKTGG